ncbi:Gfo/Idh/MocA family protein [Shouchella shacheensis]|uniref:Gfo/Idh/MocA family protein n=1 Tax=Shouchella shacheensis TaxID=1649580 RepID=UPI0007403C9C|nr:Gfo/Idh/MocA family oxidoreductase [Shouchella shacheensis]
MENPLKVIQVGVGGFGLSWFELIQTYEGVEVVAVVDQLDGSLEAAKHRATNQVQTFKGLEEALEVVEADFILIVTPPSTHASLAKLAIKHGLHVMMEKPLTNTLEEGRRLLAFTKKHPKKVMISQNYRWNSQIQTVKELLIQGAIGEVEYGDYYFNKATRFGGWRDEYENILLQDMSIHHFDILRYLLEKEVTEITATSFRPSWSWFKGMPHANVNLMFEQEIRVSYTGRWAGKGRKTPWNGELRLVGKKGAIELVDDRVFLYDDEDDKPKEVPIKTRELTDRLVSLELFIHSILKDTIPPTSIEDNIKSIELTAAAIAAAKTGEKVVLSHHLQ